MPDKTFIPIRDEIASHARPLIRRLVEKIKDEYGCTVQIGCEKECHIQSAAEDRATNMDEEFAVRNRIADDYNAARRKTERSVMSNLGRASQWNKVPLENFHSEIKHGKYEFKTLPTHALQALERIDAQCQRVSHDFSPNAGYIPYYSSRLGPITAGLHVNFSVWKDAPNEPDKAVNLCHAGYAGNDNMEPWNRELKQEGKNYILDEYMSHDRLLIAPTNEAIQRAGYYQRQDTRYVADDSNDHLERSEFNPKYIARQEFRAPSSDARHDLAFLMLLTAVYKHLAGEAYENATGEPGAVPTTRSEAIERFENSSRLIPDLLKIMESDSQRSDVMVAHVNDLKESVIAAARENRLHQPTWGEISKSISSSSGMNVR